MFLVTRGAGFIGSHLVERFLREGHRVRALDNFSSGTRENLAFAAGDPRLEVVEADITDLAATVRAMRDVEVVFCIRRSVPDGDTLRPASSRDAGRSGVRYAR